PRGRPSPSFFSCRYSYRNFRMAEANETGAPGPTPAETAAPPAGAAPDAVTAQKPGDETRIALPPRPRPEPPSPESLHRLLGALDKGTLVPLLLALGFFLAAFPVRNSDLLMHLATGRALVEGRYNPFSGADPFGLTTEGVRWVNHSWLYDLLAYGVYRVAGIPGLVAAKALLVALLALVLVRVGQAGRGLWVPVLCATLAVLALGPRLLLQPACVSFLFLGLTLWALQRGGGWLYTPATEEERARRRPSAGAPVTWANYWPLLPLFALWANLDEWFFLGPLTVAL